MEQVDQNPFKKLSDIKKVIYPVLIGLGVVVFFLFKDFNPHAFDLVSFSYSMVFYLLLAIALMMMRDIGYMYRIRVLCNDELKWRQAFRIIMLWEFSSAVMPSAVGGTTVAMLFLNREGINLGRSTAVVMATSFLDELYFILMFPLLLITIRIPALFTVGTIVNGQEVFTLTNEFLWFAVIGYSLKLIYTVFLSYGLFINPRGLKWLLLVVFKIPFLRRFRYSAHLTGSEIISSSTELKQQKFSFWFKAFAGTFFSWSARYLVVNALFLAFFTVSDHFLLFARQLVMSNMMLVSPTPGGSGFSEYIFTHYLADFIQGDAVTVAGLAIVIALIWRLISYYPYLLIGSIILPGWLRRFNTKQ